jgi:hypothetical protein
VCGGEVTATEVVEASDDEEEEEMAVETTGLVKDEDDDKDKEEGIEAERAADDEDTDDDMDEAASAEDMVERVANEPISFVVAAGASCVCEWERVSNGRGSGRAWTEGADGPALAPTAVRAEPPTVARGGRVEVGGERADCE